MLPSAVRLRERQLLSCKLPQSGFTTGSLHDGGEIDQKALSMSRSYDLRAYNPKGASLPPLKEGLATALTVAAGRVGGSLRMETSANTVTRPSGPGRRCTEDKGSPRSLESGKDCVLLPLRSTCQRA